MSVVGTENILARKNIHGKILARKNIGTAWHEKSDPFLMGENMFRNLVPCFMGKNIFRNLVPFLWVKIFSGIWSQFLMGEKYFNEFGPILYWEKHIFRDLVKNIMIS